MNEDFALKNVVRGPPTPRCRRAVAAALPGVLWTARGYKPGYLWDVNEPTESTVADCLRLCGTTADFRNDEKLLLVTGDDVRAVRLGRDVLLCNVPETLRRLEDASVDVKFVDVSAGLRSPNALASPPAGVRGMLSSLKRRLADVAASPCRSDVFVDLEPADGEWNLCTAFGVLLGYPVVYWFEGGADAGNCLAMEELNVVRVRSAPTAGRRDVARGTASSAAGMEDDVYSFSFPVALGADLRPHVDAWWQRLRVRAAGDFELTRVDEVTCHPVVAL
ncbi:UPF0739 protein C1orf74 homolog [Dermacentor andersoni]|uniref:UPF0739 protein C1orf74 homolog n=1 Tax=Dermacentor andersoni TaxID=34620 RepID=UPI0021551C6D|nr:UPF0739 protein C1orf74 homolog [Dermacentor andersoni]